MVRLVAYPQNILDNNTGPICFVPELMRSTIYECVYYKTYDIF